jgi:hypothetical protein
MVDNGQQQEARLDQHEGACLCGEVRYSVAGQPMRVTVCHCRFCQRATGTAYLVEPIFPLVALGVIRGKPSLYEHRSEGSGKMVHVHFCANCGTKLYYSFERFPDVVGVFAGTFDDPNWFERGGPATKHIFLNVAQRGTVIPAGVNAFQEHAATQDGTAVEPSVFAEHHLI